ncbi:AI-2E family transporter [bacterium]|nr:MAG: AI-2E family transporter [bacterium]
MDREISISTATILKVIGVLLVLGLIFLIRDVVVLVLFAVILTSAIEPFAARMENKKIPRVVAVAMVYVIGALLFGTALFFLIPPLLEQVRQLAVAMPSFFDSAIMKFESFKLFAIQHNIASNVEYFFDSLSAELGQVAPNIFSTTKAVVAGTISVVVVLAVSFYMSVEKGGLKKFIEALTPENQRDNVMRLVKKSQAKLGKWVQGQFVVILLVGVLDFLGLFFIGARFALLLGIMGAILEIIPYAGPMVATMIVFLICLSQSLTIAILAGVWFLIVQQIENHVITPKIMQSAVGLNPIVVILAILIGTKLAGVLGLVLAVPVAAVIEVLISDFMGTASS